ncbi:MAG: hypothetical protein E6Q59_04175 [Nitrosomonas sp.]|nr:MAG: hypothetical protein E6Q59_04175 [Nitrosomonas sp.]
MDGSREEAHLAAQIRASMDKYTLAVLLAKLKNEETPDYIALLKQIKDNVATQLISDRNTLGLRGFGYLALGLNKAYPDTLVQPITYFATSLLYTANRAYKKWCEARQRAMLCM